MYSHFQSFRSFADLQCLEQEDPVEHSLEIPFPEKQAFKTSANYIVDEKKEPLQSRSKKKFLKKPIQTSFENNILENHIEAAKELVQKYFKTHNSDSLQLREIDHFSQGLEDDYSKVKRIISSLGNLERPTASQLIKDLENEPNFVKFLVFLHDSFHEELQNMLLGVSFIAWEKYVELIQKKQPSDHYDFLEEMKSRMTQTLKQSVQFQLMEIKLLLKENTETNQEEFIAKFTETIYLVIEEYFENPYSLDGECPLKRPASEISIEFSNEEHEDSWSYAFSHIEKRRKKN